MKHLETVLLNLPQNEGLVARGVGKFSFFRRKATERDAFRIARGVNFLRRLVVCLYSSKEEKHAREQNAAFQMFLFLVNRMAGLICDLEDQSWVKVLFLCVPENGQ